MYQKMMERQDAKIAALDEKMTNIANKWQDKAKELTQKSFELKNYSISFIILRH